MKLKWPGKVLRIHFKEQNTTKILGGAPGGKYNIIKGWQDNAYLWKENIESFKKKNLRNVLWDGGPNSFNAKGIFIQ